MEIPKLAIDKESKNLYHIYLFYVEGEWCAFGYSAYYLNILYPILEAAEEVSPKRKVGMPCVHVPESYLTRLSDFYNTLVSDTHIQISAPPTAYCFRNEYDEWCKTLAVI